MIAYEEETLGLPKDPMMMAADSSTPFLPPRMLKRQSLGFRLPKSRKCLDLQSTDDLESLGTANSALYTDEASVSTATSHTSAVSSHSSRHRRPLLSIGRRNASRSHSSRRQRRRRPSGTTAASHVPKTVVPPKRVSFACQEATIVAVTPEPTPREVASMFYTRRELHVMARQAQVLGEETAWKLDKHVAECLHFCYFGIAGPNNPELTKEKALNYYYLYEAPQDNGTTTTTLRGVERHVSSRIADYKMDCIQAVLAKQTELRHNTKDKHAVKVAALCKTSASWSSKSRRFARLLGKCDAAVCGYHNSSKRSEQQAEESS